MDRLNELAIRHPQVDKKYFWYRLQPDFKDHFLEGYSHAHTINTAS
jgi:hypothetical protein